MESTWRGWNGLCQVKKSQRARPGAVGAASHTIARVSAWGMSEHMGSHTVSVSQAPSLQLGVGVGRPVCSPLGQSVLVVLKCLFSSPAACVRPRM